MKALIHYLILVGIPVLGILGVLQLGQGLVAPKAVAGAWTLEIARVPAGEPACAALENVTQAQALAVEQSGPDLVLELGGAQVKGQVDGSVVRATSPLLLVDASVEPSGAMRGTLSFPSCPTSPTLAFTAARQLSQGAGG